MKKNIEILAPAGTMESLYAAVSNGANAIYLGGKTFGARAYAGNFDEQELKQAIAYAHERNVKIYVTTNILVMDSEVTDFLEYVSFLYQNDVDALIIQDIGMVHLLRNIFPNMPLHSSTQMTVINSLDTLYVKKLGIERVVYARENSVEELKEIQQKTGMESETFVHGALCICYSGNCLFSTMMTNRSGNRGSCSQNCRMKYRLEKNGTCVDSGYLLSAKDLSTLTQVGQLIESGIDSWKIEGRMKRPEYVATVVKHYSDMKEHANQIPLIERYQREDEIRHIFQREYTTGFLLNDENKNIVNPLIPKNKGILIGKVLRNDRERKRLKILLEKDIEVGDGLSTGEKVGRILVGNNIVNSAQSGQEIELDYVGNLKTGDEVYKTYSKKIMEGAKSSYQKEAFSFPVTMLLELKLGKQPVLNIEDEEYHRVSYMDDMVVAEAKNKAVDEEFAYTQLSKLGDTPYKLEKRNFSLKISGNVFVSKSDLNRFRREAIHLLSIERQNRHHRTPFDWKECYRIAKQQFDNVNSGEATENRGYYLSCKCRTKEQLETAKKENISRIYVETVELYDYAKSCFNEEQIYYSIPDVVTEKNLNYVENLISHTGKRFLTNSLGIIEKYQEYDIVGDYLLNLSNKYSLNCLNAKQVTPSLEWIFSHQMEDILSFSKKDKVEIPIYLTPMVMIMEYDVTKTNNIYSINDQYELVSQKGERFPIWKDELGKTRIFLNEPKELKQDIKRFYDSGFRHFRIEFLNEGEDQVRNIIRSYKNYLEG